MFQHKVGYCLPLRSPQALLQEYQCFYLQAFQKDPLKTGYMLFRFLICTLDMVSLPAEPLPHPHVDKPKLVVQVAVP
jgi:hypothetical protein